MPCVSRPVGGPGSCGAGCAGRRAGRGGLYGDDCHTRSPLRAVQIHVPAGKRIALTVINADPLSEEFNSSALKVEKVIAGKSQGVVHIGPFNPGRYDFIGEYHEQTAKGQVIAE